MKWFRVFSPFIPLLVPFFAFAAAPKTFSDLAKYVVDIMNSVVGIMIVTAVVIYFFGVARQMAKSNESDTVQKRKFLLMGIAILFVMTSIWGILEVLDNTLQGRTPRTSNQSSNLDIYADPNSFE